MRRFRVSIAGLMAAVLFVAVGVAALREASEVWLGTLFGLTCAAVGFAILRATYRDGARRASWAGFALFGGGYLLIAFAPGPEARPGLATTQALNWLHPRVARSRTATLSTTTTSFTYNTTTATVALNSGSTPQPLPPTTVDIVGSAIPVSPSNSPSTFRVFLIASDPVTFVRVGHCLLAMLIGMLGGGIARWQWSTGTRGSTLPPPGAPTEEEPPCPAAAS